MKYIKVFENYSKSKENKKNVWNEVNGVVAMVDWDGNYFEFMWQKESDIDEVRRCGLKLDESLGVRSANVIPTPKDLAKTFRASGIPVYYQKDRLPKIGDKFINTENNDVYKVYSIEPEYIHVHIRDKDNNHKEGGGKAFLNSFVHNIEMGKYKKVM